MHTKNTEKIFSLAHLTARAPVNARSSIVQVAKRFFCSKLFCFFRRVKKFFSEVVDRGWFIKTRRIPLLNGIKFNTFWGYFANNKNNNKFTHTRVKCKGMKRKREKEEKKVWRVKVTISDWWKEIKHSIAILCLNAVLFIDGDV